MSTPGSFARLRPRAGEGEVLMVPDAAVTADQAARVVMTVVADGVVVAKPVILGPVVDGLRVVRGGISATDQVITAGLHPARPGTRVTGEVRRPGITVRKASPDIMLVIHFTSPGGSRDEQYIFISDGYGVPDD